MLKRPSFYPVLILATAIVLIVAACGGSGGSTATPAPTAVPTAAATPTQRPTPTPSPTATPTPTPTPGVPTPIANRQGKRGGTLSLRAVTQTTVFDPFDVRATSDYHTIGVMFNNLIWP